MLVVTIRCTNKMIEAPLSYSKSYPALVDREHREQDRSVDTFIIQCEQEE